ncbi:SH3-like domain-containing protein [Kitasatospora indigofera]|uniref:SH3-like domain-containing protein n=1 Tax=Kitasatospora indigofera TaxID=67307 RepID=UPI0033B62E44
MSRRAPRTCAAVAAGLLVLLLALGGYVRATGGWLPRLDEPVMTAGQARDRIDGALHGSLDGVAPAVPYLDDWYDVARGDAHWDGEASRYSLVGRSWRVRVRLAPGRRDEFLAAVTASWQQRGYRAGPALDPAGRPYDGSQDHVTRSATTPDGVFVTVTLDGHRQDPTAGQGGPAPYVTVVVAATVADAEYGGASVYGKPPPLPADLPRRADGSPDRTPGVDDPYWSH